MNCTKTMTLYHGSTADGTTNRLRFHVYRTTTKLIQRFWHCTLMHAVRCGFDGILTVRFGVISRHHNKTYSAVQCDFEKLEILWCGSVRFSEIAKSAVRLGAVFRYREPYGAV